MVNWVGALNTHLSLLEALQTRFLRLILSNEPIYSSEKLYMEAKILDDRRLYYFQAVIKYCKKNKMFLWNVKTTNLAENIIMLYLRFKNLLDNAHLPTSSQECIIPFLSYSSL